MKNCEKNFDSEKLAEIGKNPDKMAGIFKGIFSILLKYMYLKNLIEKGEIKEPAEVLPEKNEAIKDIKTAENENEPKMVDLSNLEGKFKAFFEPRGEIVEYLKKTSTAYSEADLAEILELTKMLEERAVKLYLEQNKNCEPNRAKAPMSLANVANLGGFEQEKIFSREDISKMSGNDYFKNEQAILKLLKEGKIK